METENNTKEQPIVIGSTREFISITVDKVPVTAIERFLIVKNLIPGKRFYKSYPIVLGNMTRIGKVAQEIPDDLLISFNESSMLRIAEYADHLVTILAIGLKNGRSYPSKRFINRIRREFSMDELFGALQIVFKQLCLEGFIKALIIIKGQSILDNIKS